MVTVIKYDIVLVHEKMHFRFCALRAKNFARGARAGLEVICAHARVARARKNLARGARATFFLRASPLWL